MFEDNPFFYYIYLNAERVSLIRDYLYFYRKNRPGSTTMQANLKYMDLIKSHDLSKDIFVQTNNYETYKIGFTNYCLNSIFGLFHHVKEKYKYEFFCLIKDYLKGLYLTDKDLNKIFNNLKINYENFMNCVDYCDYKGLKLQKETIKLQKENSQLKKINNMYKNKLIKMESSNSWRLTRPLRIIVNTIKNLIQ